MTPGFAVLSISFAVAATATTGDGHPRNPAQRWTGRACFALALLFALLAITGGST